MSAELAAPADAITVSDLFCLYSVPGGGSFAALRGLSLHVASGERLVMHGPNGSGKTTLLRVLSGEVAAGSGSVTIGGTQLVGAPANQLTKVRRDLLGLVDQHSGRALRAELSVLDNVAVQLRLAGTDRRRARSAATDALAELGLAPLATRRPATLSAGEAQRVAVCAAIVHRPAVVLADEPTGELDIAAADAVYDLLAEAARSVDATLVLVTHDARAARIADRVVRIRDGRLSELWHPATPGQPELVVDDRGWLRLPDAVRQRARLGGSTRVQVQDGAVVLTGPATDGPNDTVTGNTVTGDTVAGDTVAGDAAASDVAAMPEPPGAPGGAVDGAVDAAPTDTRPLARACAISLRYGDRVIFAEFSVDIAAGRLTVVRGRSGAGKSTLLRLLLGLADPDAGDVELAGSRLAGLDRAARAALRQRHVGVVTQSGALAEPLDAVANLTLARTARGLAADADAVDAVLQKLSLAAVARRPVRLLSGGERQRVSIARALVVDRPLLVLDEPTSQQDEAHAELVTAVLSAAADTGAGVLCATHDEVLADAAAHVLELG